MISLLDTATGFGALGPMLPDCAQILSSLWTIGGDGWHFRRWFCDDRSRAHHGSEIIRQGRHTHTEIEHSWEESGAFARAGGLMMAGVPAETQGSTALKALATDKISTCILQSANLLQLLRNSSHSEIVAKLPKDLSLKIPNIKTTGELLEQMPSVIVALDSHLDNAIRSSSMLKEVRAILVDGPRSLPTPLPTNYFQDSSSDR